MTDFERIVESYLPAAKELGFTRDEVEEAIVEATRFERMCPSCRYSQAPYNAVGIARREEFLPIFNRSCQKGRPVGIMGCSRWEVLQVLEEATA